MTDIDAKQEYILRMSQVLWQTRREIEYIERNFLPRAPEYANWSRNIRPEFDELRLMLVHKVNILNGNERRND